MATTNFAFGRLIDAGNGPIEGLVADGISTESLTPTALNQQTTAAATEPGVVRVATDTLVYVAVGSNPNATNGATRQMLPANTSAIIGVKKGDKAAVVTA